MKRSDEIKYFDKVWKEMSLHLKLFLETGNQENLHSFRVQIKKLKALIILTENTDSHLTIIKLLKPVSKLFKTAGRIREAHINLSLTEKYKIINEPFTAGQNQIITNGLANMRLNSSDTLLTIKDANKQIKKKLPKIKNSFISAFYNNQLELLNRNLEIPNFTEEMHQNRKLIKLLVYNHKLAVKALNNQINLNIEYLDKLQNKIGEWHDNLVAAQLFSTGQIINADVAKVINRKNNSIKKYIKNLATDFIKKATLVDAAPVEVTLA